MKKNDVVRVSMWEERKMRFGNGLQKTGASYWSEEKIRAACINARDAVKLNGVNSMAVVKMLSGELAISQISGYNSRDGMYCYFVNSDGVLSREV